MVRRRWLLLLVPGALLAACDSAPTDAPADAVRQRLVGTWLREYDAQGAHVRRILVLEADGSFREMSSIVAEGAAAKQESQGAGSWLFDGTNLKRHYASINGKPVSAPVVPFATFEISFPSKAEFTGLDRIRRLEVHYERVADGTEP